MTRSWQSIKKKPDRILEKKVKHETRKKQKNKSRIASREQRISVSRGKLWFKQLFKQFFPNLKFTEATKSNYLYTTLVIVITNITTPN